MKVLSLNILIVEVYLTFQLHMVKTESGTCRNDSGIDPIIVFQRRASENSAATSEPQLVYMDGSQDIRCGSEHLDSCFIS